MTDSPPTDRFDRRWWADAVFYQIYPRSFADLSGDGVGDLPGVTDRIGYLELLGVDAIWLSPVTRSPMADHGYDVSDPRDLDPLFGGMAAFDALLAAAHASGIKVVMDLVPNHTSNEHPWFQEALASPADSATRERYIFRDGRGPSGDEPPNNWRSIFGGPAWTRITEPDGTPGQWYLHLFAPEQPDLDWNNPEVWADLEKTMRFWLDRGIDGFRIDVAHGMAKPHGLPDMPTKPDGSVVELLTGDENDIRFNNPGVHRIHRKIRRVLNDYPDAVAIGEIWVRDGAEFAQYVRPDELHLGFNFALAEAPWSAARIRAAIDESLAAVDAVRAVPTWTLSNHDVDREVTRLAKGDTAIGTARARALILVELALPGTAFIYNGAELGLPNVDLPDSALQDPVWERSGHTDRGRDGCRVPLPWGGDRPPYEFSTSADTWLPMPDDWAALTTEAQLEDADSTLSLYRAAIELRKSRSEFSGDAIDWYGSRPDALAFRRRAGGLICAVNAGAEPIGLPPGVLLLSSSPLTDAGLLPPDSAAWLVPPAADGGGPATADEDGASPSPND